jgi:hypothetical protein
MYADDYESDLELPAEMSRETRKTTKPGLLRRLGGGVATVARKALSVAPMALEYGLKAGNAIDRMGLITDPRFKSALQVGNTIQKYVGPATAVLNTVRRYGKRHPSSRTPMKR